jgi:hypothetical protein
MLSLSFVEIITLAGITWFSILLARLSLLRETLDVLRADPVEPSTVTPDPLGDPLVEPPAYEPEPSVEDPETSVDKSEDLFELSVGILLAMSAAAVETLVDPKLTVSELLVGAFWDEPLVDGAV